MSALPFARDIEVIWHDSNCINGSGLHTHDQCRRNRRKSPSSSHRRRYMRSGVVMMESGGERIVIAVSD
jgi:hypothetical protein